MAEIINFRQVKKARERAAAAKVGAENRARKRLTKADLEAERMRRLRLHGALDGARISEDEAPGR